MESFVQAMPDIFASAVVLSGDEDSRTLRRIAAARRVRNRIACDLLLAGLYKHHPAHAMAALKGVKSCVADCDLPAQIQPAAESTDSSSAVIPIPAETMTDMIGRRPTMLMIMRAVCKFYNVSGLDVCSERRTSEIVLPRQVVMYLGRQLTLNSQPSVGRFIGGRDHTTVLHGARKIARMIEGGGRLADDIAVIKLHIADAVLRQPTA